MIDVYLIGAYDALDLELAEFEENLIWAELTTLQVADPPAPQGDI